MSTGPLSPPDWLESCVKEVGHQFVGKKTCLRNLCVALVAGLHVLVEDLPGTGKTTLAKAFARACRLDMGRIQCTPDLLPGDVLGMLVYDRDARDFRFKPGAIMHSMVYADELNRCPTRTQAAFLEAMEESTITVENRTMDLPSPFFLMATQNPQGFAGTFPLPEAQLDRFGMKFSLGFPDEAQELAILDMNLAPESLQEPQAPRSPSGIMDGAAQVLALRAQAGTVTVHEGVKKLVTDILQKSRTNPRLRTGFPPRAGVHLIRAARGLALLEGRSFCTPDDVLDLAMVVLSHRVVLSPDARVSGISRDDALQGLLDSIPKPQPRA